jgi:flagellar biosynthetic protein FliQ
VTELDPVISTSTVRRWNAGSNPAMTGIVTYHAVRFAISVRTRIAAEAPVMNEGDVLEIVRSGMYTALIVAGPALAGALLTGVTISVLQALTQVQEMTLANIPKIFMTLLLVMLFLPLSFAAMRSYMDQIMQMVVRI